MSPRTEEQFAEMREASRTKILDSALELFGERGYHATSISQIARKAGTSQGLLYNYFDGKSHLLEEIYKRGFAEIERFIEEFEEHKLTRANLTKYIESMFRAMLEHEKFWRLFYSIFVHHASAEEVAPFIERHMQASMTRMTTMLERLGSERPGKDAYILGSMLDGVAIMLISIPSPDAREPLLRRAAELITKTFYQSRRRK